MSQMRSVRSNDVELFLRAQGWVLKSEKTSYGSQYMVHSNHPGISLGIPVDPTYSGAESVLDRTLKKYVECTGEAEDDVRTRVAHIQNDVIQVRVFGTHVA